MNWSDVSMVRFDKCPSLFRLSDISILGTVSHAKSEIPLHFHWPLAVFCVTVCQTSYPLRIRLIKPLHTVAVSCWYDTCFAVKTCDGVYQCIFSIDRVGIPFRFQTIIWTFVRHHVSRCLILHDQLPIMINCQ